MFIRTVKKITAVLTAVVLGLSLAACSSTETIEPVSVLCPTGAPALSILGTKDLEDVSVDYVEGTDVLTAELAKEDGDYDIIVAPTNLGAKIYSESETYQLAAVLTWGNLYLVGEEGVDLSTASIAAFGESAVPGLVFKAVEDENLNVTWYASVAEAQQALLAGQHDAALLAMPAAQATIANAANNGQTLTILQDLQQLWAQQTGSDEAGYPQASLFVKEGSEDKVQRVLEAVSSYLDEADSDTLTADIDEITAETLGLPNTTIAVATFEKQNIRYVQGQDAADAIAEFLSVFNLEVPENLIAE